MVCVSGKKSKQSSVWWTGNQEARLNISQMDLPLAHRPTAWCVPGKSPRSHHPCASAASPLSLAGIRCPWHDRWRRTNLPPPACKALIHHYSSPSSYWQLLSALYHELYTLTNSLRQGIPTLSSSPSGSATRRTGCEAVFPRPGRRSG